MATGKLKDLLRTPRMGHVPMDNVNSVKGLLEFIKLHVTPETEIVELGSFQGVSTLLFSQFAKKVYTVDFYDYVTPPTGRIPEMDKMFVEAEKIFIERTKDIPNIVKIRKSTLEAAKDFKDGSVDVVYIDAEHDYASVKADIRTWVWKVKEGGILAGHDYHLPHIPKILEEERLLNELTVYPDTSWSVRVKKKPTISLVAVACTKVPETIEAIYKCVDQKKFDLVQLFTHENVNPLGIEVVKIPKLDYKGYNEFVAMELWKYVRTDYVLLVQNDSWILDGDKWDDSWLEYDFIGSVWPIPPENDIITYRTPKGRLIRVGNGGFSLRSRKLLEAPTKLGLKFTDLDTGFPHEDGFLCVHRRDELEECGIKYAPPEVAVKFARELDVPESKGISPFGFHRYIPKA